MPTTNINVSYNVSPYVALAICEGAGSALKILPETIVIINTSKTYTTNTLSSTIKTSIPVSIPAGSRVCIICGHTNDTPTTRTTQTFYFAGGIAFW